MLREVYVITPDEGATGGLDEIARCDRYTLTTDREGQVHVNVTIGSTAPVVPQDGSQLPWGALYLDYRDAHGAFMVRSFVMEVLLNAIKVQLSDNYGNPQQAMDNISKLLGGRQS